MFMRRSCRAFTCQPVPDALIKQMLELAQRTASWCNTQPWRLFVSAGENTEQLKKKLAHAVANTPVAPDLPFPVQYQGEHLVRRREVGHQLYNAAGIARGDRAASAQLARRNFELFGAPHCLVLAAPTYLGPYALVDCGGWVSSFLLAAQALGIAAVPQASLAQYSDVLREHFSIGGSLTIVCGIAFGFEQVGSSLNAYRTARADVADVCVWYR